MEARAQPPPFAQLHQEMAEERRGRAVGQSPRKFDFNPAKLEEIEMDVNGVVVPEHWEFTSDTRQKVPLLLPVSAWPIVKGLKVRPSDDRLWVEKVWQVQNPELFGKYQTEINRSYLNYGRVDKMQLFHGTSPENLENILFSNLLTTKAISPCTVWVPDYLKERLQKSVYFTKHLNYAYYFSNGKTMDNPENTPVFILVFEVLAGRVLMVTDDNRHKIRGYESYDLIFNQAMNTVGNIGNEYWKFHDNECYPLYVMQCEKRRALRDIPRGPVRHEYRGPTWNGRNARHEYRGPTWNGGNASWFETEQVEYADNSRNGPRPRLPLYDHPQTDSSATSYMWHPR